MTLTRDQAITEDEFHYGECRIIIGPRGGRTIDIAVWRRSGRTQTWVTRPNDFSVPVSHGLYDHGHITHNNAYLFHSAAVCTPTVIDNRKLKP